MFRYLFLFLFFPLEAAPVKEKKISALYAGLDPLSISEHLALWRLFPDSKEGKKALKDAWKLLNYGNSLNETLPETPALSELIDLVNRPAEESSPSLTEEELKLIESLSENLHNRKLKGHQVTTEEEALKLPTEEIDLSRALLLSQTKGDLAITASYEALFDLMALQVLARLPKNATPKETINALSHFIFDEMHFRFPPHSSYAEQIDLYTFIPSVVDSRRGVCLGVSILYLCLAQRINIPLEIITPPGHIFVRYEKEGLVINIETTARGINIADEDYLSIDTKALQKREMKEVVGMAHMNHAALYWQNGEHQKAIDSYLIALKYMPNDPLIKEFLAYNYLFVGEEEKGRAFLTEIQDCVPSHQIKGHSVTKEYLEGKTDSAGILAIYKSTDDKRSSLITKRDQIEETLKKFPNFASGWFHLAVTHLQLHRTKEAVAALQRSHEIDPNDPTVEYYLSALYEERFDLRKAWEHFKTAEKLVVAKDHHPKALKELKIELLKSYVPPY